MNNPLAAMLQQAQPDVDWYEILEGVHGLDVYEQDGDLARLERAIICLNRAVLVTPPGRSDKVAWVDLLGNAYLRRWERCGGLEDLNKAIEIQHQAILLIPPGVDNPFAFGHLSDAYKAKYHVSGDTTDLGQAIMLQNRALELAPEGHIYRSAALANLGLLYGIQFERVDQIECLDKCILFYSQALSITSKDDPTRSIMLNGIGLALHNRFEQLTLGEYRMRESRSKV